jgi:hypothetical protein
VPFFFGAGQSHWDRLWLHGNRLGLWQFSLHRVAAAPLARRKTGSESNPEVILPHCAHPPTSISILNIRRKEKLFSTSLRKMLHFTQAS